MTRLPDNHHGVIETYRHGAYKALTPTMRLFYRAHFRREFLAMGDSLHPEVASSGHRLLAEQEAI